MKSIILKIIPDYVILNMNHLKMLWASTGVPCFQNLIPASKNNFSETLISGAEGANKELDPIF